MPFASRWMLKCAMGYLIFGMLLGALLLVHKSVSFNWMLWPLLPVHIELLLMGWVVQFTLGTAYWILPRYLNTDQKRGNTWYAKSIVILLNVGIGLVVVRHLFSLPVPVGVLGRLFECLAGLLFIKLHWNRIVSYRH